MCVCVFVEKVNEQIGNEIVRLDFFVTEESGVSDSENMIVPGTKNMKYHRMQPKLLTFVNKEIEKCVKKDNENNNENKQCLVFVCGPQSMVNDCHRASLLYLKQCHFIHETFEW